MWYMHVRTRGANYSVLPYVLRFHRYIFRIAPLVAFCTVGPYVIIILYYAIYGWWRGTVVERRSLAGELSLPCARPAADG